MHICAGKSVPLRLRTQSAYLYYYIIQDSEKSIASPGDSYTKKAPMMSAPVLSVTEYIF